MLVRWSYIIHECRIADPQTASKKRGKRVDPDDSGSDDSEEDVKVSSHRSADRGGKGALHIFTASNTPASVRVFPLYWEIAREVLVADVQPAKKSKPASTSRSRGKR
jgi:hypothetical protein